MINIRRVLINVISLFALIISSYILFRGIKANDGNTMAASLAVITAVISTWTSQKVIWKQEDDLQPDITIGFDLDSRSGLIQLLIKNTGGGSAFDVTIEWVKPLFDSHKNVVDISTIKTFLKNDTYRVIVAGSVATFQNAARLNDELIFTGKVKYKLKKTAKRIITTDFEISLEPFRRKVRPYSDEQEYHLKTIQIPRILGEINDSLIELNRIIKRQVGENE